MITVSVSTIRTGVLQRAAGGNTMKNLGLLVIALATATTVHGQERAIYRDPARRDAYLRMYGNICYDTRDRYVNFPWSSERGVR